MSNAKIVANARRTKISERDHRILLAMFSNLRAFIDDAEKSARGKHDNQLIELDITTIAMPPAPPSDDITLELTAQEGVNVRDWLNEQIEEIESGVEDGTYNEEENLDRIKAQNLTISKIAAQLELQGVL